MNGMRMGALNVYKREGVRSDDLLWTLSGHQGPDWHEAIVDIGGACYQVRQTPLSLTFHDLVSIFFIIKYQWRLRDIFICKGILSVIYSPKVFTI